MDEIVFYDENGYILKGTISNVFIKINDQLITPSLKLKILNGVLRQFLICQKRVCEKDIKINELRFAQEVYIGNAVRGLGKVSEWNIIC